MKLSGTKPGTWRRGVFSGRSSACCWVRVASQYPWRKSPVPGPLSSIFAGWPWSIILALSRLCAPHGAGKIQGPRRAGVANVKLEAGLVVFSRSRRRRRKPLRGDALVAAFYHPWSDVFLLTHWSQQKEQWRLTDARSSWARRSGPGRGRNRRRRRRGCVRISTSRSPWASSRLIQSRRLRR